MTGMGGKRDCNSLGPSRLLLSIRVPRHPYRVGPDGMEKSLLPFYRKGREAGLSGTFITLGGVKIPDNPADLRSTWIPGNRNHSISSNDVGANA